MNRLTAFIMWLLYFITPTDLYLRLCGYNPKELDEKFAEFAKAFEEYAKEVIEEDRQKR